MHLDNNYIESFKAWLKNTEQLTKITENDVTSLEIEIDPEILKDFTDEQIEDEAAGRGLIPYIGDMETEELIEELKNRGVGINKPIQDMSEKEILHGLCDRYGLNYFTSNYKLCAMLKQDKNNKL